MWPNGIYLLPLIRKSETDYLSAHNNKINLICLVEVSYVLHKCCLLYLNHAASHVTEVLLSYLIKLIFTMNSYSHDYNFWLPCLLNGHQTLTYTALAQTSAHFIIHKVLNILPSSSQWGECCHMLMCRPYQLHSHLVKYSPLAWTILIQICSLQLYSLSFFCIRCCVLFFTSLFAFIWPQCHLTDVWHVLFFPWTNSIHVCMNLPHRSIFPRVQNFFICTSVVWWLCLEKCLQWTHCNFFATWQFATCQASRNASLLHGVD